jgi:Guanosine polyphosphate pyrophosphohydrolases/synthetases
VLTERFEEALIFAAQLHRKQKRKTTGTPYISHLLVVSALVLEDGGTEDQAIAALLHDSIEDQARYYPGGETQLRRDIRKRFGKEVLRIVEGCTEDYMVPPGALEYIPWRELRRSYIEHTRQADPAVRRVIAADKLHNVRSLLSAFRYMGDRVWERFQTKSGEDQLWFYEEIARVLAEKRDSPLAEELLAAVQALRTALEATRKEQR